jgi:hypothetical protein
MSKLYVKNSGVFNAVKSLFVKSSGTWNAVNVGYVKNGGTWNAVFKRNYEYTVSSNTTNINLNSLATSLGWGGTLPIVFTLTINSGVSLGSSSTSNPALLISSFPAGTEINIINNGYIVGAGGAGGNGRWRTAGDAGSNGGDALSIAYATNITNNGTIGGGGVGGGGGCAFDKWSGGGGGGGAGYVVGAAAQGATGDGRGISSAGTLTTGGARGTPYAIGGSGNGYGWYGGVGGSLGQNGLVGNGDYIYGGGSGYAFYGLGAGGTAGKCTSTGSNANITWLATGTRLGTLG